MKFVVRDHHIVSLGGYIVERNFPYRNLIVVNKLTEPVKVEIPIFEVEWVEEHENLGLDIIPVSNEDNFLNMFKKAKKDLEESKKDLEGIEIEKFDKKENIS